VLDARVKAGGQLVPAMQAALPAVKKLLDQCLEADIPGMLGPCAKSG